MPSFESPIGNKSFSSSKSFREIDVPDESNNSFDVERAIQDPRMKALDPQEITEFQRRLQYSEVQEQNKNRNLSDVEQSFKTARQARKIGNEPLSEGARRRIEFLIGMTRLTRIVVIENTNFVLQTLKSKEMRESLLGASEFDRTIQSPFEIRKQLLARSLISIGDVDIEAFLNSNSLESRLEFIEEMDHELLGRLYEEYLILAKESKEKFAIKNNIENAKDVEGVVDAIKK